MTLIQHFGRSIFNLQIDAFIQKWKDILEFISTGASKHDQYIFFKIQYESYLVLWQNAVSLFSTLHSTDNLFLLPFHSNNAPKCLVETKQHFMKFAVLRIYTLLTVLTEKMKDSESKPLQQN